VSQKVGPPWDSKDERTYRSVYVREGGAQGVARGWYLADDEGRLVYRKDVPIQREAKLTDFNEKAPDPFKAPQPQLFQLIVEGILAGTLEWALVITGVLIAIVLELMGISALPVAVGMYLGLSTATPIFVGGIIRWLAERWRGASGSETETETSPGVLLSSGYIAGGTLCGLIIGFFAMLPKDFRDALTLGISEEYHDSNTAKVLALFMFAVLAVILFWVGKQKPPEAPAGEPPR
jgi:hypothetical protein